MLADRLMFAVLQLQNVDFSSQHWIIAGPTSHTQWPDIWELIYKHTTENAIVSQLYQVSEIARHCLYNTDCLPFV